MKCILKWFGKGAHSKTEDFSHSILNIVPVSNNNELLIYYLSFWRAVVTVAIETLTNIMFLCQTLTTHTIIHIFITSYILVVYCESRLLTWGVSYLLYTHMDSAYLHM